MSATEIQLQNYHRANYDQVDSAVKQLERAVRAAVGRNDIPATVHLTNTLMMMVAVKAEARLNQILYLPDGFNETQRRTVLGQRSLYEKWQSAVEVSFRAKFSVPPSLAVRDTLLHSDLARYDTIVAFLSSELQSIIHLRNKLAHGQWLYPLNSEMTEISSDLMKFVKRENCVTLFLRNEALIAIGNIVSDLIQSQRLFQSRFDTHYLRVQKVQRKLVNVDYEAYKKRVRARYLVGVEKLRSGV